MKDKELNKSNNLYQFFSYEIYKLNEEIKKNSDEIYKLSSKQEYLKRGKTELVKLRRELKDMLEKDKN